jgi:MOSC domain-containing protein YiiM
MLKTLVGLKLLHIHEYNYIKQAKNGVRMSGKLEAIWLKRMKLGPMDCVEEVQLLSNSGIVGNADRGGRRQVTIISKEVWDALSIEFAEKLDPAIRRANFLVSGIDLRESRGKILQVGDCEIKIYGETRPCERMDMAVDGLKKALSTDWRGGAYGVVLNNGIVRVGDKVKWKVKS